MTTTNQSTAFAEVMEAMKATGRRSDSNTSESVYITFEFREEKHRVRFSRHDCGYSRESIKTNDGWEHGSMWCFSDFYGKKSTRKEIRMQPSNTRMEGDFLKIEEKTNKKGKTYFVHHKEVEAPTIEGLLTTDEISNIIRMVGTSRNYDYVRVY